MMSNNLGIKKTHKLMTDRLTNYIKSQYFGDNQLLLNASDELLTKEGNIYQKPYIESTPSYVKVINGISKSNIDSKVKLIFEELIENRLGVFNTPFKHQIDALESFVEKKNLFVATGTGSGKTECFMWPMIYKLMHEAVYKKSWNQRGVRAIVIYPMNALVSDQISRLRSIIGDRENKFVGILNKYSPSARRPQFGMYTGRTPYPGAKLDKKTNLDIGLSYEKSYLVSENLSEEQKQQQIKDIEGLKRINKYPSKNMEDLVRKLKDNNLEKYDSSNDAELLLRYEMQKYTPDILITNYSMLEYMLIREIESNIWDETKKWLNSDDENKLLIIIDEAHMYSGASGGEVALLIRRLFSKLGITSKKTQFILTSASMPNETMDDLKYIHGFSEDISGCNHETFKYLFGEKEKVLLQRPINFNLDELANLELDNTILDEKSIERNIELFAKTIYKEDVKENHRLWLYNNMTRYIPFVNLLENCRGKTMSYSDLQRKTINNMTEKGERAFENLLLLAPLAKDINGNVLFPARIHLFFRGLNGIYSCLNPSCKCNHIGDDITLGNLYTNNYNQCMQCHSKVFEIVNDRRCGALFIKTFIHKNTFNDLEILCWNKKGIDEEQEMIEFPLFIIGTNYDINSRPKNTELAYFDYISGKLYSSQSKTKNFIKVLRSNDIGDEGVVFKNCPHCTKKFSFVGLSDFKVKGNLPFYNIIKAQFDAQPMVKEPSKFIPNGGKKVLLFSDSRQSAALLARDMTKISDKDSFRKAIFLAMDKIYNAHQKNEFPLSYLYPAFVEVCVENKLRFFYGSQLDKLEEDKINLIRIFERYKKMNKTPTYDRLCRDFNTPRSMYQANMIELFCSPVVNFQNLALGYIAPLDEALEEVIIDLDIPGLKSEDYISIFVSFVTQTCTDSFCFDNTVKDDIRREVKYKKGERYGFKKYNSYVNSIVKNKYPCDYEKIYESIVNTFYRLEDDHYFLNIDMVKIVLDYDNERKWYRCSKCGNIQPFTIENHCAICASKTIYEEKAIDIKKIEYWRNQVLSDEPIKSLNTEEHTAQLSFNDQTIKTWAKTEDYEMRFQDINVEKLSTAPIDILSCTTTMEVGIDIGSLTAIGLRNVPPLRENYQQRAGRAGRRGSSLSTISVYAQGGPHDTYYFNSPDKIIKGKLRKPWIDIRSDKIIYRHFNLVMLTKYFENTGQSFYEISACDFAKDFIRFKSFIDSFKFDKNEISEYFLDNDIQIYKQRFMLDLEKHLVGKEKESKDLFDILYQSGILPTYSFPLNVIEFNIEDERGNTKLAPQRGIDVAISEYAPGRTLVVDKKTYKSAGIYSPIRHKNEISIFRPAEPYFNDGEEYVKKIYMCENKLCGWFSKTKPINHICPFCGGNINDDVEKKMLVPWGFAPLNAKEITESEADTELTYADEPCYSSIPSNDLICTKYKNIKIANRYNEEIIVLNKGSEEKGFDVCRLCGAAQPHGNKTLKENGVGMPFTINGERYTCSHKNIEEGIFLGTCFRTDMFFVQIEIDTNKITDNAIILKSATITLCEAMKIAVSRILDISYNDLAVGNRTRTDGNRKYIDIYFYDSLSSGAGYSTQIENYLDEVIENTYEILREPDERNICNFWNQRIQYLFNRNLALNFLDWMTKSVVPKDFDEEETRVILKPLMNLLENEYRIIGIINGNSLHTEKWTYNLIPGFKKKHFGNISDFDIQQNLPSILESIINKEKL